MQGEVKKDGIRNTANEISLHLGSRGERMKCGGVGTFGSCQVCTPRATRVGARSLLGEGEEE